MDHLFLNLKLIDVDQSLCRNITAPKESEKVYDDLTESPEDLVVAEEAEANAQPPYWSGSPAVGFSALDLLWQDAIGYPFNKLQPSRFSDGSFGVWYGSDKLETSIYETAYHLYYKGVLDDANYDAEGVVFERSIYFVKCSAELVDLRVDLQQYPDFLNKKNYTFCRSFGARLKYEGYVGLLTYSARYDIGLNFVILDYDVLSDPHYDCCLTYELQGDFIRVEKISGEFLMNIELSEFA